MTTIATNLPSLTGTDKQIAWAEDIRRRFELMWDQAGESLISKVGTEAQTLHDAILSCPSAEAWIEGGRYIPSQLTQTPNQMVSDLAGVLRDWKRMEAEAAKADDVSDMTLAEFAALNAQYKEQGAAIKSADMGEAINRAEGKLRRYLLMLRAIRARVKSPIPSPQIAAHYAKIDAAKK